MNKVYILVLDFRSCVLHKYAVEIPNDSFTVVNYLMEQGLFLGQCEWMTSTEPITEIDHGKTN